MTIDRVKSVFSSIANKYPTYRDDDVVKAPSRYFSIVNKHLTEEFSRYHIKIDGSMGKESMTTLRVYGGNENDKVACATDN